MAKAPSPGDWTAIRLAQLRDAGAKFGDFPDGDANGKRVPQMDAEYARELLRYWFAVATSLRERTFEAMTKSSRDRLTSAFDAFKREMEPFAATVLVESPAPGQSFMLPKAAVLKFFDAVGKLAFALKAAALAPDASDLWWQSVEEATRDVGKAVTKAASAGLGAAATVALCLGALWLLGGSGNRKERRA